MRKHFFFSHNTINEFIPKNIIKEIRYGDCTCYTLKNLMNNNWMSRVWTFTIKNWMSGGGDIDILHTIDDQKQKIEAKEIWES